MNNQIIVAMDNEIPEGIKLIAKTKDSDKIYGYKIGSLWILEDGMAILREVKNVLNEKNSNQKIILDMQKWGTDIPDIITKQVNKVAPYVDELICCPMGAGSESLKAFADACINNRIKPICVLEMTHPDSDVYLETDQPSEKFCLPHYVYDILDDALKNGIQKFVIPATKEPRLGLRHFMSHHYPKVDTEWYATGFKVQGGQTKPMVDFGVTKFIVGRAVYESENPLQAIDDIYKEINGD